MPDDPNAPAPDPDPDPSPGAIPPIDPSINGNPDMPWSPPWLAQAQGSPVDPAQAAAIAPPIAGEIQMPDDYVGKPLTSGQFVPPNLPSIATEQQQRPPWLAQQQAEAGHVAPSESDAVSGGAPPDDALNPQQTQDRFAAIATDPNAPGEERAKAWASMTPDQRTNVINTTDPKQLAAIANPAMSQQELATIAVRHNAAKLDEETTRLQAIYAENDRKAKEEAAAQALAVKHADEESAKDAAAVQALVARSKVNPNQRGFGRTLADAVLAGIGGAMSQYTGGKNLALESMQKRVEQNIQQQTEELSQGWKAVDLHKNAVAAEYARHGDLIRAQGVVRLAALQSSKEQLMTEMQDYDPAGTTALAGAQTIQQINGLQAKAAQDLHQLNLKNGYEQAKVDTEAKKQLEESRHNKATEGVEWAKVGLEKDKNAIAKVDLQPIPMDVLAARHPGLPMPPAAVFPQGMSEKQYSGWLEAQSKGGEIAGKVTENAQKLAAGQVRDINGDPATDAKGNIIQVEPKAAEHANNIRAKGQEAIDALSAARRLLASDPSTIDRATWGKIHNDLLNGGVALAGTLGEKTSPRAIEETLKLVGDDYDSYTQRYLNKGEGEKGVAMIDNELDTLTRNLNTEVKTTTGIKTSANFFNTSKTPPTKETPEDKADKILTQNFGASDVNPDNLDADDRAFAEAAQKGIPKGLSVQIADYAESKGLSPLTTRALHANVAPVQLRAFDQLEAAVKGGNDAARAQAVEHLDKIAEGSKSAGVRAYAKALIDEAASTTLENTPNQAIGADGKPYQLEPGPQD